MIHVVLCAEYCKYLTLQRHLAEIDLYKGKVTTVG
jgi:hypothetical protein